MMKRVHNQISFTRHAKEQLLESLGHSRGQLPSHSRNQMLGHRSM